MLLMNANMPAKIVQKKCKRKFLKDMCYIFKRKWVSLNC